MADKQLRLAVFADGPVGYRTVEFLYRSYPSHLQKIVLNDHSGIGQEVAALGIESDSIIFNRSVYSEQIISQLKSLHLDYLILAWWPYIIKQPIFEIPAKGILNYHPSFLPYNRGKNYNFWTLVEDTPFGVTIHFVDEKVDSGDIVFQKRIDKSWEDTGESLYWRAQKAMIELFEQNYARLIAGDYQRIPQDPSAGSFHYARELDPASEIHLDRQYSGRALLNLIRARVFPPHPSCYFCFNGRAYKVTIQITKADCSVQPRQTVPLDLSAVYTAKELLKPCATSEKTQRECCFYDEGRLYNAILTILLETQNGPHSGI